jgi:hypothetical protein
MSSPNQLSFLPDDYLERKAARRTNAICAILFLLVMSAIGTTFSISERSTKEIDRRYNAKLNEFTTEAKRISQAEKLQEKQRTMSRQAELSASLLEKVPRSYVLADITNALPPGASLLDFTLDSKRKNAPAPLAPGSTAFEQRKAASAREAQKKEAAGTTPNDMKLYDVSMRLTGIAQNDMQVAVFIRRLNESKLLKDVNLVITDQFDKDNETLRKFVIECMLDPKAEIVPDEAKNTTATEVKPAVSITK